MAEDIVVRFWRRYVGCDDSFKKEKCLKYIVVAIEECIGIEDAVKRKRMIAMMLKDYFDDLIGYMETRYAKKYKRSGNDRKD